MKLMVFLLLVNFAQLMANNSFAQKTKLSVDLKNVRIESVLLSIENQSFFKFIYNKEKVDVDSKVSISVQDKSINEILDMLFERDQVSYSFYGNQVILTKTDDPVSSMQTRTVSGKVTDPSGAPLPGVTVVIKGTSTGTITGADGDYTLSGVPANAVLVFSFVGMKTQEIAVAGKTTVNMTMTEETVGIEEVVAIGYGTVRKADLTGSVTSVSARDFDKIPASTPLQSLTGRTAGVQITTSGGMPGAGAEVLIRGVRSVNGTNAPIYVVDGVISTTIDNLDPVSIESVSVLKDASAAAIYGARAANGVILVTTKRGAYKKGIDITLNSYYGIQTESNLKLKLLNSAQYLELLTEAYANTGLGVPWDASILEHYEGVDTDWQDLITQNGVIQNYNLSLNGGSEKSNYYVAAGYQDQKGRVIETAFKKYTLTFNTDHQINDWIKFGNSLNIYSNRRDGTQSYGGLVLEPYETAL
ncbi:MAG: SusC/RagA family TonB-linked outer membrane protein [Mangrovibacterium sp.]|nr:SusC/RagA family TonB-linked outer membrane protein [Mangrovibacterium sp.]